MDVASEHIAEDGEDGSNCIMLKLISFNFGMHQGMLEDGPWARKHAKKFDHVLDTFFELSADVVMGCEVGGHMQGMSEEQQKSLQAPKISCSFTQNYMIALHQEGVTKKLLRPPQVTELAGSTALEPQLVLTAVQAIKGDQKAAITVIGNMYIRTPSGGRSPTITMRQRLVKEALGKLEDHGKMLLQSVPASERPEVVHLNQRGISVE